MNRRNQILRAHIIDYRNAGRTENGKRLGWKDVYVEIMLYSETPIAEEPNKLKSEVEKLKRFCVGRSAKDRTPSDSPEIAALIENYLTHPDKNLINPLILKSGDMHYDVLPSLQRFLSDSTTPQDISEERESVTLQSIKEPSRFLKIEPRYDSVSYAELFHAPSDKAESIEVGICIYDCEEAFDFLMLFRDILDGGIIFYSATGTLKGGEEHYLGVILNQHGKYNSNNKTHPFSKIKGVESINSGNLRIFERKILENQSRNMEYFSLYEKYQPSDRNGGVGFVRTTTNNTISTYYFTDAESVFEYLYHISKYIEMEQSGLAEAIAAIEDINAIHPQYKLPLLHMAALRSAYPVLKELLKREDLDLLIPDQDGHRAWLQPYKASALFPNHLVSRYLRIYTNRQEDMIEMKPSNATPEP